MRVMLYGTESVIHVRRYIRLLELAGCETVLIDRAARRIDPQTLYRVYPRRFDRLRRLLGSPVADRLHRMLLRHLARSIRPDIHHVQWIDDRAWHCAKAGLRPLVATAWGSDLNWMMLPGANPAAKRAVSEALRALDMLIVDSPDMAEVANTLAGTKVNSVLLPLGIDTKRFRPDAAARARWRSDLAIEPEALVVLSPRAAGANYRQAEIIRAFAAWRPSAARKAYLVIRTFGSEPDTYVPKLKPLATRLGIDDAVRWVGDRPYKEVPGQWAVADIAINFPGMDAFPVTILEALASGVPLLTNRLPAYEASRFSEFLQYIDENSEAGLMRGLTAIVAGLESAKALALRGRDQVVMHDDERVTARRLRALYESLGAA